MNVLKSHFEANGLQYGQYPAHSVDKGMELMFESQSNSIASAPLLHSYPPMASAPPHVPFFVLIPEQEREKRREERLRFLASRHTPRLSKAFINKQCLRVKQSSQPPPVPAPAPSRTAAGGAQRTAPVEDEEDDDNEYNDDEFEETGAIEEGAPTQQPPAANDSDDSGAYDDEDFEPTAPVAARAPTPRAPLPVVLHQERGRSLTRDRRVSPLHARSLSLSRSQSRSRSRSASGSRSRSATRRCQQRLLFLLALVEEGHVVPPEEVEAAIRACDPVDRDALCYPPPPPRPTIPQLSGRHVTAKCIKPRNSGPTELPPVAHVASSSAQKTPRSTAAAADNDAAHHCDDDDDYGAADPPLSPAVHRAALASLAASSGSASPRPRQAARQLLEQQQQQQQRQLRRQQQALHSQLLAQPRHQRARSTSTSRPVPARTSVERPPVSLSVQATRTRQQRYAEAQRQEHWAAASTPSASAALSTSVSVTASTSPLRPSRTPPSSWSWSSPHRPRASVSSSIHSAASSTTVAIPSDRLMMRNPAIAAAFLRESNAWRSRYVGKVPSPRDAAAHRSPMRSPQPALSPIGFRTTPRSAAKASAAAAVVFDSAELSQLYD